jgi:hypothetical protein
MPILFIFATMRKGVLLQLCLFVIAIAFLGKSTDSSFSAGHPIYPRHASHYKAKNRTQVSKPVAELKKVHLKVRYKPAEIRFAINIGNVPLQFFCIHFRREFGEEPPAVLAEYHSVRNSRGPPFSCI